MQVKIFGNICLLKQDWGFKTNKNKPKNQTNSNQVCQQVNQNTQANANHPQQY